MIDVTIERYVNQTGIDRADTVADLFWASEAEIRELLDMDGNGGDPFTDWFAEAIHAEADSRGMVW
jgi:hypothetical protein